MLTWNNTPGNYIGTGKMIGAMGKTSTDIYAAYLTYKARLEQASQIYENAKTNLQLTYDTSNAQLEDLSFNEGVFARAHLDQLAEIETTFSATGVDTSASNSATAVARQATENYLTNKTTMRKQAWAQITSDVKGAQMSLIQAERNKKVAKAQAKAERNISYASAIIEGLGSFIGGYGLFKS